MTFKMSISISKPKRNIFFLLMKGGIHQNLQIKFYEKSSIVINLYGFLNVSNERVTI